MKKVWLICSLFLAGCDASFLMNEEFVLKEGAYQEVASFNELVKMLNEQIQNGEYCFRYQSEEDYLLDDIVKHLSFLLPFDIKVIKSECVEYSQIEVICLDETYEEAKIKAKQIIEENIDASFSVSEKIDFVYNYIIENCEYDASITTRTLANERAFQCAGVLFDGRAVCSGYARTFLLFMNLLEIPCLYLPSDVINHGFNVIYDGNMRYFDLTWDDGTYRYYKKDKKAFFEDGKHQFDAFYDDIFFERLLVAMYL